MGTSNNRKAAFGKLITFWRSLELHSHHNALGLATAPSDAALGVALDRRPVQPITLLRPHAARRAARFFVEKFPGRSLYAVKANPSPDLIALLWDSGITHFDVASIAEVKLVAGALGRKLRFGCIKPEFRERRGLEFVVNVERLASGMVHGDQLYFV